MHFLRTKKMGDAPCMITEPMIRTVMSSMFQKYSRVEHQLHTMDQFMLQMVPSIIAENNITVVKSKKFKRCHVITFGKVMLYKPTIKTPHGTVIAVMPSECRKRGLTYAADVHVDVVHEIYDTSESSGEPNNEFRVGGEVVQAGPVSYGKLISVRSYREVLLCELPIMVQSSLCYLSEDRDLVHHDEDIYDSGGYFIVNGNEKPVPVSICITN